MEGRGPFFHKRKMQNDFMVRPWILELGFLKPLVRNGSERRISKKERNLPSFGPWTWARTIAPEHNRRILVRLSCKGEKHLSQGWFKALCQGKAVPLRRSRLDPGAKEAEKGAGDGRDPIAKQHSGLFVCAGPAGLRGACSYGHRGGGVKYLPKAVNTLDFGLLWPSTGDHKGYEHQAIEQSQKKPRSPPSSSETFEGFVPESQAIGVEGPEAPPWFPKQEGQKQKKEKKAWIR
jgi:hypothetical protein